jgi:hypothetical protein
VSGGANPSSLTQKRGPSRPSSADLPAVLQGAPPASISSDRGGTPGSGARATLSRGEGSAEPLSGEPALAPLLCLPYRYGDRSGLHAERFPYVSRTSASWKVALGDRSGHPETLSHEVSREPRRGNQESAATPQSPSQRGEPLLPRPPLGVAQICPLGKREQFEGQCPNGLSRASLWFGGRAAVAAPPPTCRTDVRALNGSGDGRFVAAECADRVPHCIARGSVAG